MAESLKCSCSKHLAKGIALVERQWPLKHTCSRVAAGAGETTRALPRLCLGDLEAGRMAFPSLWLPVLTEVKAVLPRAAPGQQHLVVETSVSRMPAALLPSHSVWAGPVSTSEGVLPPWEAFWQAGSLTWAIRVWLGLYHLKPIFSAGSSFTSRCYGQCCATCTGQMLMKDSPPQAEWCVNALLHSLCWQWPASSHSCRL